ncbi:MAG TPA: peroxidase family protein [Falsiroseomonas sp.]|jgi:hypothetical protein|nr:peroxidase family protein [Falsiroseomonas sp.]
MIGHGTVVPAAIASALARHVRLEMPMPFGRLFDEQPSIALEDLDLLEDFLFEQQGEDLDSAHTPAGFTFFGQFIDHDVTLTESATGAEDDLTALRPASSILNLRTPDLELDSVFGFGPEHPISRVLFRQDGRLLTGADTGHEAWDLPRQGDGTAIIADPRNDENKIVAQVHAAFIRAYNRLLAEKGNYAEARIELYHTYQYILLNDYLKRFVDPALVEEVREAGAPLYSAMAASAGRKLLVPLEFSVAAFRFGHSQVRAFYRLNRGPNAARPIFSDTGPDLNGREPIGAEMRMDFTLFFDDRLPPGGAGAGGQPPGLNMARRIDTKLSLPLMHLKNPGIAAAPGTLPDDTLKSPRSLAKRNLFRARQLSVVSGQRAATLLGQPHLTAEELGIAQLPLSVQLKTPLWYYVLKEAERGGGERLGPVGGRILAETFLGALLHAASSYFRLKPAGWQPPEGRRTMAGLMAYAQEGLPALPQG